MARRLLLRNPTGLSRVDAVIFPRILSQITLKLSEIVFFLFWINSILTTHHSSNKKKKDPHLYVVICYEFQRYPPPEATFWLESGFFYWTLQTIFIKFFSFLLKTKKIVVFYISFIQIYLFFFEIFCFTPPIPLNLHFLLFLKFSKLFFVDCTPEHNYPTPRDHIVYIILGHVERLN